MSMRGPGGNPEWWEFDPSERPVPLSGQSGGAAPTGGASFGVADEAESIVRSARDELAREDTDPTAWATDWRTRSRLRRRRLGKTSVSRMGATALLIAGCVGMFSLGWIQAIPARELPPSADHPEDHGVNRGVTNDTQKGELKRSTGEQRKKGTSKEVQR